MERDGVGAFEVVILAAFAAFAVVVAVVWGGAALAAALAGGRFSGSARDAVGAAGALPSHLAQPAEAWPPGVRDGLPGPWWYWTAELLVVVTLACLGVVVLRLWGRSGVGTERRSPLGVNARARFARRRRDLAPILLRRPMPGRFVLGTAFRRLVATEDRYAAPCRDKQAGDRGAVALVGPSRSGKTTAAVSGILEWPGPAVLASVKSDLLGATRGWRSTLGEVKVYDPTGTTGITSAPWSPLRDAGTISGAQRAARALCEAAPRGGVEGGMDFWLGQAQILVSGLLFVAHHVGRDMATVCEWVMAQDRPGDFGPGEVKIALDRLLASEDEAVVVGALHASRQLLGVWELDERTRSSIYATAQTIVWAWADPGVAAASRGTSVDLDWLLAGANTLYLCAPVGEQERLAPAFGGVLNDLIEQAYVRYNATGRSLDPPLLVVIDEAGNTPLRRMPTFASTLAGIGVLLVTVWQSIAQVEATYRRQADTILTNHLSKLFYAGLSDPASVRYVTQVLGDAEVETRSRGLGADGGRRSVQLATSRVPLAPPHALRQMRPGDALLLHGTLPPAHVRTRPYYRDKRLAARAATPVREEAA